MDPRPQTMPPQASRDWDRLITFAEEKKLKSTQPRVVVQFIADHCDVSDDKAATIFKHLLQHLERKERERGQGPTIIAP